MKFDPSRETVELHPVYDPPRAVESEAYKLCPRPWSPSDVNGVEAAAVLAAAEYEASFFAKVIQLWNRKPGDWTAFPEFLRIVYNSRVRAEVVQPPADSEAPVLLPINEYRRDEIPAGNPTRKAA